MSRARFALVAGGGTGGHLVPALAVARALADHAGPDSVELVGTSRGIDAELLADCGLPVTLLPGRGLVSGMGLAAVGLMPREIRLVLISLGIVLTGTGIGLTAIEFALGVILVGAVITVIQRVLYVYRQDRQQSTQTK